MILGPVPIVGAIKPSHGFLPPPTKVPVPPVKVRRASGMGTLVAAPYLRRWPNGRVIGLGSYVDAPHLTRWPDGRPIAGPSDGSCCCKRDLVVMALSRATTKKKQGQRRDSRGMGDSTTDYQAAVDATGGYYSPGDTVDPYSLPTDLTLTYPPIATAPGDTSNTYNLPTSIPLQPLPPLSESGGLPTASPSTSGLTNFFNTLTQGLSRAFGGGSTTPPIVGYTASGAPIYNAAGIMGASSTGSISSALSQRPIASLPLSYGGILLLTGGVIVLGGLMGRSGGRRRR